MIYYLKPVCPLFSGFNSLKQGTFSNKKTDGPFVFQVFIYLFPNISIPGVGVLGSQHLTLKNRKSSRYLDVKGPGFLLLHKYIQI